MVELSSEIIKKYSKRKTSWLKQKAQEMFNAWIRERDKGKPCISCPRGVVENAGHYYPAGHYNRLRTNEDNVHGQCIQCNLHKHGNLIEYRKGLIKRIGEERVQRLDLIAGIKTPYFDDRIGFIEIIQQYKPSGPKWNQLGDNRD